MNTEREKSFESNLPQVAPNRSVRWRRLGMITVGGGLALLLAATAVANGPGGPVETPTVSVATRIAELSTQQAKNEKDLADLKTQEAVLSTTPTSQSGTRVEVTVVTGPNQPSINIGIDQDFNFPGVQATPPQNPTPVIIYAPPPTSTFSPPELTATVVAHDTALAENVAKELADRAERRAAAATPTPTPTSSSTPTPTSTPTSGSSEMVKVPWWYLPIAAGGAIVLTALGAAIYRGRERIIQIFHPHPPHGTS